MPRVFISHSSSDRDFVEREIIAPLRGRGVETWYSKDDIRTSMEWERSIHEALKGCDWFLVVLSPRAVASRWVRHEVHWAMLKRENRVVPVIIEACEPDELHIGLLPLQFIDFRADPARAKARLLEFWGPDKSRQIEDLYRVALRAIAARDWAVAAGQLEAVLRLDPEHAKARKELERVRREASQQPARKEAAGPQQEAARPQSASSQVGPPPQPAAPQTTRAREGAAEGAARQLSRAKELADCGDWQGATRELKDLLSSRQGAHLHEAARTLLDSVEKRRLGRLYDKGKAHLNAGDWGVAVECFREIKAIKPLYQNVDELIAKAERGQAAAREKAAQRQRGDAQRPPAAREEKSAAPVKEAAKEKPKPSAEKPKPSVEQAKPSEARKPAQPAQPKPAQLAPPKSAQPEPSKSAQLGSTKSAQPESTKSAKPEPTKSAKLEPRKSAQAEPRGAAAAPPVVRMPVARSENHARLEEAKELLARGEWDAASSRLKIVLFVAPESESALRAEARSMLARIEVLHGVPHALKAFADGKAYLEAGDGEWALHRLRAVKSVQTSEGMAQLRKTLGDDLYPRLDSMIETAERAASRRRGKARSLRIVVLAVVLLALLIAGGLYFGK